MPDGTVITNVPEGITQSDLNRRYASLDSGYLNTPPPPPAPTQEVIDSPQSPIKPRNIFDTVQDNYSHIREGFRTGGLKQIIAPLLPAAEVAYNNPEAVGATIASMAAPELAAPAAVAKYGPLIQQAVAQGISRIPMAFMGGASGREVGRITGSVTTDPNAELSDILLDNIKVGGQMAAAEATGVALSPLLTKVFAPGAASLTKESDELMRFAQDRNVPTSPAVFSPSNAGKVVQGGADTFLPSRLAADNSRKKAVIRFNQLMTEIPEEVGEIKGNQIITPDAIEAIKTLYNKKELVGKDLANEFLETIGHTTDIKVAKTRETLDSIMRSAVDPSLRDFASTKIQQFGKKAVRAEDLETALRQIGKIKPKSDTKFLETLRNSIKDDFRTAGAPVEMLDEANQAFKENIGLLAGQGARQLKAMLAKGEEPTFLTAKIFRNGNEPLLKSLISEVDKGALKKDVWDSLRAQNLQNMIQNSSTESKKLMGLRVIDGAKLEKMLESNRSSLEIAYKDNPKTLEAMRNLARLAKASRQDLTTFEEGMGETLKAGNVTALAAAAYTDPVGLILGSSSSFLLAKSMMNPKGKVFKWLTTGLDGAPTTIEGLKMGGRLLFKDDAED